IGGIGNINLASTTITMNADKTVTANFSQIPATQYTLTINTAGNGTTTGAGTYDEGTAVPITATLASGWEFVNWTGDIGGIGNINLASTTITMNADKTVTANFSQIPPDEPPASNFAQETAKLTEAITNVAATGENSEVSLVFSEATVNDEVAQSLVGTTIDAGVALKVTAVNLDLQAGNIIVAELKGTAFILGMTIKATAQVNIQEGKPVVEVTNATIAKSLIDDAITQAVDNLLTQLTQTGTGDDEKVDIEFTDIIIQEDSLTLVVMVKPIT
ncbi:MAG: hypothetical protein CL873_03275, partial [Dehalococcoidales bacterium]|nr:hypothetical protein [Dehalococcoidales bacterium]